ncbi:MAG: antibiotic biosynthesis monooxygenase [Clostridia bacterium]|nr:antibiotic biosynthesis monooxygenase [Clostridia bacterium]
MSISINIYYSGRNGAARKFAKEMMSSGTVSAIRNEKGNLQYDYFYPVEDNETVLLIDSWVNQDAIDMHHHSPMMRKIMDLREKYDLHMRVLRFVSDDVPQADNSFIRE